MGDTYQALVVTKNQDKSFSSSIEDLLVENLPDEEVLVRVHYSTINYKDCLSCQGNPSITRRFPHTPGIDAAGVVEASTSNQFQEGDPVVIMGQPMGLNSPGGFGQYIRVPASWLQKMGPDADLEQAMVYGTAGYTAALSVDALLRHFGDIKGKKIIVTGATGGVGCVSVALLSKLGCQVTAITGKSNASQFLTNIGASEIRGRSDLESHPEQNLLRPIWDGAIDVAGGKTLSTLLKLINDKGCVVATGMVNDTGLNTTVLPFILRGINLIGINAENTVDAKRQEIWKNLTDPSALKNISALYTLVPFKDLAKAIDEVSQSKQIGRIVVDMR